MIGLNTHDRAKPRTCRALAVAAASVAAAAAVLAAPWWGTFPLISLSPIWLKLIASPILGGRFLAAGSTNPMLWAVSIPGAALCVLAAMALARLRGRRWAGLAGAAVATGLTATVAGSALGPPGESTIPEIILLTTGCFAFGVGLAVVGARLAIPKGGNRHRASRWLRILLVSAGASLASFALFPLGMLLLVPALALGAFVLSRKAARAHAQAP